MDTRNPLLFPDLLHNILDHLSEYYPSLYYDDDFLAYDQRTLLALAQTCRDFLEPSLDRLWREIGSLKPLIRCYGGDPEQVRHPDERKLTPPTSGKLNIIRRYSPRIRKLYLCDSASMQFLRYSNISLQSPSFFPNLTCLIFNETRPHRFGIGTVPIAILTRLLIDTPKITALEVVFARKVDGVQAFLRDLHQICPNLRTFTFKARPYKGKQTQILHHFPDFSCFKNLQYISLDAFIDHITFENLSLSSLPRGFSAVVLRSQSTTLETSLGPSDIPFLHAKHVSLRVWDLNFVINLLRPRHQAFDYIDIFIDGARPTASSVYAFFKALASTGHADSLQTIRLAAGDSRFTPGCLSLGLSSLLPSFRRLETLVIDLGNISIDDDQLAAFGCLRSLQVLKLTCWADSWPLVKHPTLNGVLALVGSCQQLQELTLCIDARQVPQDADAKICNTTLTTLKFLDSPIGDSGSVARFISKHLPSVKDVFVPCSCSEEPPCRNCDGWYAVCYELRCEDDDE